MQMEQPAPPSGDATPLDRGLRALCAIAAYYRIGADPVQLHRELALGDRDADEFDLIRSAKQIGLKARLVTGRRRAPHGKACHPRDRPAPQRSALRLRRAGPVGLVPAGRSDHPCGDRPHARRPDAGGRRSRAPDRPSRRRRRSQPETLRAALVPADAVALPQAPRACARGVAVHTDLRADDATRIPGHRRQGSDPSRLRDAVRHDRGPRH